MASAGRKCSCILILVLGLAGLAAPVLRAQQAAPASTTPPSSAPPSETPKALNDKLADLDKRVTAAQSAGDNAWMLVSAALERNLLC